MRYTNTITLRAHSKSEDEHQQIRTHIADTYGDRVDFEEDTLKQEGFDDIHVLTAKLYHQPPQKLFLEHLHEYTQNLDDLREEAELHFDARQTFFFRLDKERFFTDTWEFVHKGDVIQVRINVCAHPKNEETALQVVREMLA